MSDKLVCRRPCKSDRYDADELMSFTNPNGEVEVHKFDCECSSRLDNKDEVCESLGHPQGWYKWIDDGPNWMEVERHEDYDGYVCCHQDCYICSP